MRKDAEAPASYTDEAPPYLDSRTSSLRGFGADGLLKDGLLAMPGEADAKIRGSVRAAGGRHHPRACSHLWLLPRAHRKELSMASLATLPRPARSIPVNDTQPITDDEAYAAFERRDRTWDGRVIGAVKTTGIYCRPSCPARRPKRENVEFFTSAARGPRPAIAPACAASPTR